MQVARLALYYCRVGFSQHLAWPAPSTDNKIAGLSTSLRVAAHRTAHHTAVYHALVMKKREYQLHSSHGCLKELFCSIRLHRATSSKPG